MKKIYYFYICLSAVASLVLYSCVKDYLDVDPSDKASSAQILTVEEAKQFFEKQMGVYATRSVSDDEQLPFGLPPGEFTPIWDDAFYYQTSKRAAITVPILSTYRYRTFRSEEKNGKYEAYVSYIQQKLVIVLDEDMNQKALYIESVIPDRSCKSISNKTYDVRSKEFSGIAMYHNYQGELIRFSYLKNGKLKKSFFFGVVDATKTKERFTKYIAAIGTVDIERSIVVAQTRSWEWDDDEGWFYVDDDYFEDIIVFPPNDDFGPDPFPIPDPFEDDDEEEEDEECFLCGDYPCTCSGEDDDDDPDPDFICQYGVNHGQNGSCDCCTICQGPCQIGCEYNGRCHVPGDCICKLCEEVRSKASNWIMNPVISGYMTQANASWEDREHLSVFYNTYNIIKTTEISSFAGTSQTHDIEFSIPNSLIIDGIVHHHWGEGYKNFSATDLHSLGQIYNNGNIRDSYNFAFGVVTSEGAFFLNIEDPNKFNDFMRDKSLLEMEMLWFKHDVKSDTENLVKLLSKENTGVTLKQYNPQNKIMKNLSWDDNRNRLTIEDC